MPAKKYLVFDDTLKGLDEQQALDTSAGQGSAGAIVALDADGKIADNMMPDGVAAETQTATASEELAANDVVNLYLDTILKVRKADASDATKPAHGYVKEPVLNAGTATVYTDGKLPGTGFTPGAMYFLSETAGAVTTTPPTTDDAIVQAIGPAVSATAIKFDPARQVIRRYNPV
jgi:hypothetical protein